MKKLLTYMMFFVLVCTGIVSCNTDIEALDVVVPDEKSEEYWENLRAYKARDDHEVFFGWFGGWTANSADMINYLRSVPDSVDIISIWGAYQNLSEKQLEDLRYVQDVRVLVLHIPYSLTKFQKNLCLAKIMKSLLRKESKNTLSLW